MASQSYVKGKIKDCEYCGIPVIHTKFDPAESKEWDVVEYIRECNKSLSVGGIILQLPLPKGWNEDFLTRCISHRKDVDGFLPTSKFKPCTPEGIMYVLHKELGDLTGMNALVIGRGKLVGKPIAQMLLDADCTVTVAHSKSKYLVELLDHTDIVISAVGKPNTLDLQDCWTVKAVIDVGVNRDANGKLCGDCYNFDEKVDPLLMVTPVPKGIGLMTRAMLMKHMGEVSK
jgi:methylenetetrahydrofolate dehydrogenase (NADP+)/methenyltetrahydrofolate cyclohydrolase